MPRWPAKTDKPRAIKLLTPYSFLDEDGVSFAWPAHKVLTNKYSIEMLLERSIPYELVEEE